MYLFIRLLLSNSPTIIVNGHMFFSMVFSFIWFCSLLRHLDYIFKSLELQDWHYCVTNSVQLGKSITNKHSKKPSALSRYSSGLTAFLSLCFSIVKIVHYWGIVIFFSLLFFRVSRCSFSLFLIKKCSPYFLSPLLLVHLSPSVFFTSRY